MENKGLAVVMAVSAAFMAASAVVVFAFQPESAPPVASVSQAVPPKQDQAQNAPNDTAESTPTGEPVADQAWVAAMARATSIPKTAVNAYANAQLAAPADCGLGWTTLAGIGWIESHHGTINGRTLLPSGQPSEPVLGIPLGQLDRAYGPMQFIPSTWKKWGMDGNGDGVEDPHNIYDAALSAAHYLCHSGQLNTGDAWGKAVYSYNHSWEYVADVNEAANRYAMLGQ